MTRLFAVVAFARIVAMALSGPKEPGALRTSQRRLGPGRLGPLVRSARLWNGADPEGEGRPVRHLQHQPTPQLLLVSNGAGYVLETRIRVKPNAK